MQNLNAHAAAELIEENRANPDFVILDVRTPGEFRAGKIADAQLLDFYSDFETAIQNLPRDKTYFVYCRSGVRSVGACEIMEALGFAKCLNLEGGIIEWHDAGLPINQ